MGYLWLISRGARTNTWETIISHGKKVAGDHAEASGVMLENWCWVKDVLSKLSSHYTTLDPSYLAKWREEHPRIPNPPPRISDKFVRRPHSHEKHRPNNNVRSIFVSFSSKAAI